MSNPSKIKSIGLLGFGAFGRLIEHHLKEFFPIKIHDPMIHVLDTACAPGHQFCTLAEVATCDLIILAMPVQNLGKALRALRDHLRPGTIVMDVGSVKMLPVDVMRAELPSFVDIVACHPLFGPQSTKAGLSGHQIVICPVRGRVWSLIAAFLKKVLGLKVIVQTPEQHDREMALVQGMTHLLARVRAHMTFEAGSHQTPSFALLNQAIDMVVEDAENVFHAIEHDNPFANAFRQDFMQACDQAMADIEGTGIIRPKLPHLECHNVQRQG